MYMLNGMELSSSTDSADSLLLHLLREADRLVGSALDDTPGFGELGANAHEVSVDVTGCLTAFIDAPKFGQLREMAIY